MRILFTYKPNQTTRNTTQQRLHRFALLCTHTTPSSFFLPFSRPDITIPVRDQLSNQKLSAYAVLSVSMYFLLRKSMPLPQCCVLLFMMIIYNKTNEATTSVRLNKASFRTVECLLKGNFSKLPTRSVPICFKILFEKG